ncbi:Hypothetical protein PFR_JS23-PH_6 [Propionibacterium freudenreichii]|uniref:Uncharacterized protein n=1 Tax=Propionibacterium freudenreichii TaxID=1744 RepID=A0A509MH89_9ACTN|nr:Hypothetical protein PFR_JS23-PH_6 [Propionibacterium freudenreichii]SUY93564.1 Hypothetical protein PFR_JS23-PH_6 [Propionibacterium freudenreichii]
MMVHPGGGVARSSVVRMPATIEVTTDSFRTCVRISASSHGTQLAAAVHLRRDGAPGWIAGGDGHAGSHERSQYLIECRCVGKAKILDRDLRRRTCANEERLKRHALGVQVMEVCQDCRLFFTNQPPKISVPVARQSWYYIEFVELCGRKRLR